MLRSHPDSERWLTTSWRAGAGTYLFILRMVAAGGARPDEADVGGGLLLVVVLLLGRRRRDDRGGGQVVLHGAHVVEAIAPCHGRPTRHSRAPPPRS